MNTVDLVLSGLFFLSFFYGYRKGFIQQAVGLIGLILSLFVAYSFSEHTAVFLQNQFPLPKGSSNPLLEGILSMTAIHTLLYTALAFALLFFVVRLLCRMTGKLLQAFAELPIISLINRSLGSFISFVQMFVILLVGLNLVQAAPDGQWKKAFYNSIISQYMLQISPMLTEQFKITPQPNQTGHRDIL